MQERQYFRIKKQAQTIIDTVKKHRSHNLSYNRKIGQDELEQFEKHLKNVLLSYYEKERSKRKFTYPDLGAIARLEREKTPFSTMDRVDSRNLFYII